MELFLDEGECEDRDVGVERPRRVSGLKGWVCACEGMMVSQIMASDGGEEGLREG